MFIRNRIPLVAWTTILMYLCIFLSKHYIYYGVILILVLVCQHFMSFSRNHQALPILELRLQFCWDWYLNFYHDSWKWIQLDMAASVKPFWLWYDAKFYNQPVLYSKVFVYLTGISFNCWKLQLYCWHKSANIFPWFATFEVICVHVHVLILGTVQSRFKDVSPCLNIWYWWYISQKILYRISVDISWYLLNSDVILASKYFVFLINHIKLLKTCLGSQEILTL